MKNYVIALVAVASCGAGMFLNFKLTKTPVCNCPEIKIPECAPAIKVQSLDVDKLRKIKGGFTFAPVYNGDVYMVTGDTLNRKK